MKKRFAFMLSVAVLTTAMSAKYEDLTAYELHARNGKADTETRLTLKLSDALSSPKVTTNLTSFSLCMWFKVTTFLEFSVLLSYAVSDDFDDVIRISVTPDGITVKYMMEFLGSVDRPVSPLKWYPVCLVVSPTMWKVWMGGVDISKATPTVPLPLDGLLVLGQDQDQMDGGYSPSQSFLGQVTGLSMWDVGLTSPEILAWSQCKEFNRTALLSWPDLPWTLHNQTGHIRETMATPCSHTDEMILFTTQMSWMGARKYLDTIGLEMAVPRDPLEFNTITLLVQDQFCGIASGTGKFSWIGVKANRSANTFHDNEGEEVEVLRAYIGPNLASRQSDAIYVLLNSLGYLDVSTARRAACFTGRQREPIRFRLRGLIGDRGPDFIEGFDAFFALSSQKGRGIYFHGYGQFDIAKDEAKSRWCIHEKSSSEDAYVACTSSLLPPLGWRDWTLMENTFDDVTHRLVLTRCTDDQHTCLDVSCIDLKRMCDYKFDCSDKTDESGCVTAHLKDDYEATRAPSHPLNVTAKVAFVSIWAFDLLRMEFEVHLKLKLSWYDPWITFAHLASSKEKTVVSDGQIWQPEIEVSNGVENSKMQTSLIVKRESGGVPSLKGYLYNGSENALDLGVDIKSTVTCSFQLQWYPWDEQRCSVYLKMRNVQDGGLWLNEDSKVVRFPSLLDQFVVEDCSLQTGNVSRNITLHLHLSRRYQYHLWTTFLPTCLLLSLGYGTLFLPVDLFSERGTMSLTTMLVFMSLYAETSSSLPSTAYLKHIDVWFIFNLTFLTLIIGVHLATCRGTRREAAGHDGSRIFTSRSSTKGPGRDLVGVEVRSVFIDSDGVLRGSRFVFAVLFLTFTTVYCAILF